MDAELVDEARRMTFVVRESETVGTWTAHCLDVDVVAQGKSPEFVLADALLMAATTLKIDRAAGDDPYRRRAPEEYWPGGQR